MRVGEDVFEKMIRDFALRNAEFRRDEMIVDVLNFEKLLRDTYAIDVDLLSICLRALSELDV